MTFFLISLEYTIQYESVFSLLLGIQYQHYLVGFHWAMSNSMSPQVFRTLLSILANLNNIVVSLVAYPPLISSLFFKPLIPFQVRVLQLVSLSLPCFPAYLAKSNYLSIFSLSFIFIQWSGRKAKSTWLQVLFSC